MSYLKRHSRRWNFTWEALSHIGSLRLFLFSPPFSPANNCLRLTTSLQRTRLGRWTVHLAWEEETPGGQDSGELRHVSLGVPLPLVLVDPTAPVNCVAMDDHIHVKLLLLFPVDHPLVSELSGEMGDSLPAPLCLGNDVKDLSSLGEVDFYCRNCSTKLTKRPFRSFMEVPSVNWREAADNWFGACCCSFGAMSEKLARAYESSLTCEVEICAVDASTVIIYLENVAGIENDIFKQQIMQPESENLHKGSIQPLTVTGSGIVQKLSCQITMTDVDDIAEMCGCLNINGEKMKSPKAKMQGADDAKRQDISTFDERISSENVVRDKMVDHLLPHTELPETDNYAKCVIQLDQVCVACTQNNPPVTHNLEAASVAPYDNVANNDSVHTSNTGKQLPISPESVSFLRNGNRCVSKSCEELCNVDNCGHNSEVNGQEVNIELPNRTLRFYNGSLGSGFMLRNSISAKSIEWAEFRCSQCLSVVGSYPSIGDQSVPVDGGVRLFKCHISTNNISGGPTDLFRKHNLQRLFSNLLLESAEEELSFHTVVRDAKTNAPMLQVILLNSKTWCFTGYLSDEENDDHDFLPILQPMVKVLFYDHTDSGESESKMVEQLASKKQAEDVYMLSKEIEDLCTSLKSMRSRLPSSCSSLQGLAISFMER